MMTAAASTPRSNISAALLRGTHFTMLEFIFSNLHTAEMRYANLEENVLELVLLLEGHWNRS